jgi:hypothetical protein
MNSVIEKIYEKSSKENILYAAGIMSFLYITKSTFGMISSFYRNNSKKKEIKTILEKEKTKFMADNSKFTKYEQSYLLYLKVLNTAYRKEFAEFNKNRLKIFNGDNIYKYIKCVKEFLKNLKFIEQDILKIIFNDLKVDEDGSESEFNIEKLNIR